MTLFLRLHSPLAPADTAYHLQAELFKERWRELEQRPMPWYVHPAPKRVLLLGDRPRHRPTQVRQFLLNSDKFKIFPASDRP